MTTQHQSVALVDQCRLFRDGLANILIGAGFRITCSEESVSQLRALADEADEPSIVLFGLQESAEHAADGAREIVERWPSAPLVILASEIRPRLLSDALSSGASGYLLKRVSASTLIDALKLVSLNQKVFPEETHALISDALNGRFNADGRPSQFSRRELDVLRHLGSGESNKQIARHLNISDGTVRVHVKTILKKTGACNRTQAATWAVRQGLV